MLSFHTFRMMEMGDASSGPIADLGIFNEGEKPASLKLSDNKGRLGRIVILHNSLQTSWQ